MTDSLALVQQAMQNRYKKEMAPYLMNTISGRVFVNTGLIFYRDWIKPYWGDVDANGCAKNAPETVSFHLGEIARKVEMGVLVGNSTTPPVAPQTNTAAGQPEGKLIEIKLQDGTDVKDKAQGTSGIDENK